MTTSSRSPHEVVLSPPAMASAAADFVIIGMLASLYGPLLVTFSHRFNLSLPSAGVVLSVHFVGALCGVAMGWSAMRRWTGKVVLAAALVVMATGALGAAIATSWTEFLVAIFVIGLGFGVLDFTLNSLLVRTRVHGRAQRLSLANAGYGLGAIIGPVLIILARPGHFRYLFGAVAIGALLLSMGTRGVRAPPLSAQVPWKDESSSQSRRRTILVNFVVAYVLYIAAETTTAGWIAPDLHRVGYSVATGSLVTAGFWLGLSIGRVLAGPIGRFHSHRRLVIGGLASATVLCAGAYSSGAAPYLYPMIGLAIALVYPMGLVWYTLLCPYDTNGVAIIILFMMSGGVIGPALESVMVSTFGIHVVPLVIGGFVVLDLAVFASALRFAPRRTT